MVGKKAVKSPANFGAVGYVSEDTSRHMDFPRAKNIHSEGDVRSIWVLVSMLPGLMAVQGLHVSIYVTTETHVKIE